MTNSMVQSTRKTGDKIDSLAGLKVLAMIAIFWWHSELPKFGIDLGARACEFFFVVSGFLVMYNNYYKPITTNLKSSLSYVVDKLCKMWPLHIIGFVAVFVLTVRSFSKEIVIKSILNILCLQAWSSDLEAAMSFNGVSWFLSAILFCYFLTPFILKLFSNKKKVICTAVAVVIIRFLIEYVSKNIALPFYQIRVHTNPIVRCLEFILGMITAYLFLNIKHITKKATGTIIELLSTIVFSVFIYFFANSSVKLYRAVYVIVFCIIVFVFSMNSGMISQFLALKPFKWLSTIQFEFFMLHSVVMKYLIVIFAHLGISLHWALIVLIEFLFTILVSYIYKKFISKNLTSLMKKTLGYFLKS